MYIDFTVYLLSFQFFFLFVYITRDVLSTFRELLIVRYVNVHFTVHCLTLGGGRRCVLTDFMDFLLLQKSVETTAIQTLKRLKSLYTLSRSAANIYDLHELNLARIGKELMEKREEQRLQSDIANQVTFLFVFTARCTIVQSAVLRSHVVWLSACLSLTLADQDHIGWKACKLIARTICPTPSLFVAQRPSTYSHGNMGKFWED